MMSPARATTTAHRAASGTTKGARRGAVEGAGGNVRAISTAWASTSSAAATPNVASTARAPISASPGFAPQQPGVDPPRPHCRRRRHGGTLSGAGRGGVTPIGRGRPAASVSALVAWP